MTNNGNGISTKKSKVNPDEDEDAAKDISGIGELRKSIEVIMLECGVYRSEKMWTYVPFWI